MKIENKKQHKYKLKKSILVGLILGLMIFAKLNCVDAASTIGDLNCDTIDECEKLKDTYHQIIDIKKKQSETLDNKISSMALNIKDLRGQISEAGNQIDGLNSQIGSLENQLNEKTKLIDSKKKLLVQILQDYYQTSQTNPVAIYLAEGDLASFMVNKDRISQAGDKVKKIIDSLKELRDEIRSQSDQVFQKKAEIVGAQRDLQEKNNNLESIKKQQTILLVQTKADKAKYEKLLEEVENEIEELNSSKGEADLSKLPAAKKGYFIYPINPVKITQEYGKTSYSKNYASGKHNGIDFSANYQNVFAVGDGKVLATGNNGRYAYGKWVVIDHGDGLVTLYGHFSKLKVGKGDKINEGEVIGTSGNTGNSTGPHLHFSVFSENSFEIVESSMVPGLMIPIGSSVNPKRYLE